MPSCLVETVTYYLSVDVFFIVICPVHSERVVTVALDEACVYVDVKKWHKGNALVFVSYEDDD